MISSKSLPVGATIHANAEVFKEKLERGTIIVMISDGVLEANSKKERWIKDLLQSVSTEDIKRLSDIILQEALDDNLGIAKDDMSVMVVKVC